MQGYLGCPYNNTSCVPYDNYTHIKYIISSDVYSYTLDHIGANSMSIYEERHEEVTGTLGTPYTGENVYQDCVDLLANLPLDRDDLLPWRTDSNITTGPLSHYEEYGGGYPYVPSCESQTGSLASGTIFGKPGPVGIDRIFNPGHWNYCVCTDPTGCSGAPNTCQYVKDFGAWNTDVGGGSATEWTNAYQASNIPQYAFVSNYLFENIPCTCNFNVNTNRYVSSTLWMGKWAEIIFNKPSQNWARPCGKDRFAISESSARCVVSTYGADGRSLSLEPLGNPTDINTGDYVSVCGLDDGINGIWKATKLGDYDINLSTYVISASLLPTSSWYNCGSGMISKLRWQNVNGLQSAICGRIEIVSATNSTPITCSLYEDSYLVSGDKVNIINAVGNNINGAWTVDVISPKVISLRSSNGLTASPYIGSGQIYSPFSADYKWDDNTSKGEFSILKWDYDYRGVGEYLRLSASSAWNETYTITGCATTEGGIPPACGQPIVPTEPRTNQKFCYDQNILKNECITECLPNSSCSPSVAFFSPNNETFKNSGSVILTAKNYGFGHPLKLDEQYGSHWQAVVKQTMIDPLWESPPCPCGFIDPYYGCSCTNTQDNGTCAADSPPICYYPHAPVVESRCELPDAAPALPNGIYLGCVKNTSFIENNCPNGNVCYPPYWDGNSFLNQTDGCVPSTFPYALPWITFLNMYSCVCDSGRFSSNYKSEDGVICGNELLIVPPP
jgi:hypothetical protein